jgi:hypothetical protein
MKAALAFATAGLLALGLLLSVAPPVGTSQPGPTGDSRVPAYSPTSTTRTGSVFLPAPDRPLPHDARRVAHELVEASRSLRVSIRRWISRGHPSWARRPPRAVVLEALYQQRIYRMLSKGKNRVLARRVLNRLEGGVARFARAVTRAGARLRSQVTPLEPPITMRTGRPEPAGDLLRYYKRGQRRFRVSWEVLAAVNFIESKFGRVKSRSSAGARGPMQFLPSTWAAYGLGGDILDPRDAILGAANYLHASGAPGNYRKALFAYNRSNAYVDAVLEYARLMMRNRLDYFAFYNWQVFVITTQGDVRLTGPGRG